VLRAGLLDGRSVLLAGERLDGVPAHICAGSLAGALASLGANITLFAPELDDAGEGGAAWVAESGPFDALVYDASPAFGDGGSQGLSTMLADVWIPVAAVANGCFIPGERAGKVVLLAPPVGGAVPQASAAAADALENLARTLSIEWSRYGIKTTAVAPGAGGEALSTLVAYLLSAAGDYFTGCRFELAS
jgi:NAD(P)-dependent dehydrogenase (short-subunit alcohol dehydrogenase family)